MKKLLLSFLTLASLAALAGNTNNVTCPVLLNDTQQAELVFLKRYFGSTNSLKNFSTNVTVSVVWSPEAQAALQQRRDRIWQFVLLSTNDTAVTAGETGLGLPQLTNTTSIVIP